MSSVIEPWHCRACNAVVSNSTTRYHYRSVHRDTAYVRLPGLNQRIYLKRNPGSRRYQCPKVGCNATSDLAQRIQEHVRRCTRPNPQIRPQDLAPEVTRDVPPPAKRRQSEPMKQKAPPSPFATPNSSHLSARLLRMHSAQMPQTTRTQRALIRHCFKGQKMENKKIGEFVGCDSDQVWAAVRNEGGDNLAEDAEYLSGRKGEIVDLESLRPSQIQVNIKKEPRDDFNFSFGSAVEDRSYDSEEEIENYIEFPPDTPGLHSRRSSIGSATSSLSSLTSLADNDGPPEATSISQFDGASSPGNWGGPPQAGPSKYHSQSPPSSSITCTNGAYQAKLPSMPHVPKDCAVDAFLRGLGSSCSDLLPIFYEMEIDTAEHLDQLCKMSEDYWDEVKNFLQRRGVSLFRWLIIKKGLRDRATALSAQA